MDRQLRVSALPEGLRGWLRGRGFVKRGDPLVTTVIANLRRRIALCQRGRKPQFHIDNLKESLHVVRICADAFGSGRLGDKLKAAEVAQAFLRSIGWG